MRGTRTAMKSGPHSPQLEKALAQKRRPNTDKRKKRKIKKKKTTQCHTQCFQNMRYLIINILIEDLYDTTKQDLNQWRDISHSWIGRLNIIKGQLPTEFFCQHGQAYSKMYEQKVKAEGALKMVYSLSSQSLVCGLSATPGGLLDMPNLRPYFSLKEPESVF